MDRRVLTVITTVVLAGSHGPASAQALATSGSGQATTIEGSGAPSQGSSANRPDPAAPRPNAVADVKPSGSTQGANETQRAARVNTRFTMRILSGGSANGLDVDAQRTTFRTLPEVAVTWVKDSGSSWFTRPSGCTTDDQSPPPQILSKAAVEGNDSKTLLSVQIPNPPCWWPPFQNARVAIGNDLANKEDLLFSEIVTVSVRWFPLSLTLIAVALVYPGCAFIAWILAKKRYARAAPAARSETAPPSFGEALDPVQITANAYGRASLSKLQIFAFSLIVFALLLFFQFRNGILAALSTDVLKLLGISAIGAAGGKLTLVAKRRLSLDNWAWLTRKDWLPPDREVVPRAKWRELITDPDNKEFDIYSFQMAIFSVVVAFGLISTNATGLATFEIPAQLLGLLGLSQAIFIGGKAVEKSSFSELDEKLTKVRQAGRAYRDATHTAVATDRAGTTVVSVATARTDDALAVKCTTEAATKTAEKVAAAATEADHFKNEIAQAANMFWALYAEQIGPKPEPLQNLDQMDLDRYAE
jgi:hypothetical protein